MKTKIIPFDLEMAKKIQAGEIKGEIKTIHGCKARIIYWDRMDTETPIVLLVQYNDWEGLHECNIKGEYMEGYGDDAMLSHLVLEVPDNEPQFKPFDKVLVRSKGDTNNKWFPAIYAYYDNVVSYITIDHRMYAKEDCIPYKGNEHLVGTTDEPKND